MFETLKHTTSMRVLLYLFILLVCSLIAAFATFFFNDGSDIQLKIGQGIGSVMLFVVPPIVYYLITRKMRPMQAIGFRKIKHPWPTYLLVGLALMFVSLPVTNLLSEWNEGMKLGGVFSKLEEWMKAWEEAGQAATERMLGANTFGGLLFNLLIIALIPAVGEELTFRGLLQQSLTRSIENPHVAIWLSAFIFSFIHFQFYGFLPRMFLGLLLGYMFYATGSLWTCIIMHFINNGTVVVLYYLNSKGTINIDVDRFGSVQNGWLIAASAVLTVALIIWSWRKR